MMIHLIIIYALTILHEFINKSNKNDCFVIQYSFEQITDENQNATEKFKLFTTNQNPLRQNDATPAWRENMTRSSKSYFKIK